MEVNFMRKNLARALLMSLVLANVVPELVLAGCEHDKNTEKQYESTSVAQIDIDNTFSRFNELRTDIFSDLRSADYGSNTDVGVNESNNDISREGKGSGDEAKEKMINKKVSRDIRIDPSEVGVWMRGETGETEIGSYSYDYHLIGGGYDWHTENDAGILFTGVGFSYATNDCDDAIVGDSKSYGVSVYGSWLGKEKKEYVDLALRYGKLDKEYSGMDITGTFVSGDYDKDMFSIAAKYGRRIYKDDWYWEPSVGLVWGIVSSADYVDNYGTNIHADASNSMIASFGLQLGKSIKGIEYYTKAEVMHDFDGKMRVSNNWGDTVEGDMGGTWVKCAIGASRKIDENNSFYLEIAKDFGNKVKKPYGFGLGYRFTW